MATNLLGTLGDIHAPDLAAHDDGRPARARARAALWLTLAFWVSGYMLLTLATALSGNEHLPAIAGMRVVTTLIGLGFCYLSTCCSSIPGSPPPSAA